MQLNQVMKLPQIQSKRLIIRPFVESDLKPFLEFMLDNESTKHLMFSDKQKTEKGAKNLFEYIISSYETDEPINSLAITLKDGTYVGSCGISPIQKDQVYEYYYSINKSFRGYGYASEATSEMIDYLFQNTKMNEIRAYMSPKNPYSAAVAEACAMKNEGIANHPVFQNKGLLYSLKS